MMLISRVAPHERVRFVVIAFLLFMNAIIVQSNGVVATSGFVANVGTGQILLVWALDNAVMFGSSGAYSLFVDRLKRSTLALVLFLGAAVIYLVMYLLFLSGAPDALTYTLLMLLSDQQWILFALALWALANDIFTVPEAKRLFPLLGIAGLVGGIVGNGLAAALARLTSINPLVAFGTLNTHYDLLFVPASNANYSLMLLNAAIMGVSAGVLALGLRRITIVTHQSSWQDSPIEILREGIAFVRDIPAFRYLAIVMLLVGIGLNTIEYQLVVSAAATFQIESDLSAFYGTFRMIRMISLLAVQGLLATWVLKRIGLQSIFAFLPTVMFLALFLPIMLPGILVIAAGEYFVRIVMEGVDDPARRVFIGMVPDEQRGRVSAFFDGYLYPVGAVMSCILIALVLVLEQQAILPRGWGQPLYLALIAAIVATSLFFIIRLRATYDQSMLNWRLRRRKRSSQLAQLDL